MDRQKYKVGDKVNYGFSIVIIIKIDVGGGATPKYKVRETEVSKDGVTREIEVDESELS
jgi:hypothetical protein